MEEFSDYLKLVNNCDHGDPLLSETKLGQRLNQIPLNQVRASDLENLTIALSVEQLITTEAGVARDYRGLAELMGYDIAHIETNFKRAENPTRSLIDAFIAKDPREKPKTLNDLLKLIERIERFDVIDDFMPTLVKLASSPETSLIHYNHQGLQVACNNDSQQQVQTNVNDIDQLTIDDRPDMVVIYDAFISHAPEDIHYAQELKAYLVNHNLQVVTADDILPGQFEYDAFIRLIDERCGKVVTILTPNFSRSKACEFQTKFANELGQTNNCRKIIPVVYEVCKNSELPSMIRFLTKIDMTSKVDKHWLYGRIIKSLSVEPAPKPPLHPTSERPQNCVTGEPRVPIITSYNGDTQATINGDPIVEPFNSQSSSAISSSNEANNSSSSLNQTATDSRNLNNLTISNNSTGNSRNLMTRVTGGLRQAFGRRTTSLSSSSQSHLICSNSSESIEDQ